jgi:hypothetical protein
MRIDLRPTKASVSRDFPAGHPGRELVLSQPDDVDVTTFDAIFPSLVRLLRLRPAEA